MTPPLDEDSGDEAELRKAKERYRGTHARDVEFLVRSARREGVVHRPSGMQYKVRRPGPKCGEKPDADTLCRIHYRGILTDGTEFESTYRRGQPLLVKPAQISNVPGFREALQLMREGDQWEVILPSDLGYGEQGAGPIPGGAVLAYEIDLLEVGVQEPPDQSWVYMIIAAIVLISLSMGAYLHFTRPAPIPRGPALNPDDAAGAPDNPYVFFDIEMEGRQLGRIEFELFRSVVPLTADNFRALATGERGIGESEKPLHFKGSEFHRIVPGFVVQGGDFTHSNGYGGESIYGRIFDDEWVNGVIHHTEAGLLSMANRGPNTQSSQFFITLAPTSWLDGKHVVFGRVVRGMDVVKAMESQGTPGGAHAKHLIVADCGELTGPYGEAVPIRRRRSDVEAEL